MAGTPAGGAKTAKTNKERYGEDSRANERPMNWFTSKTRLQNHYITKKAGIYRRLVV